MSLLRTIRLVLGEIFYMIGTQIRLPKYLRLKKSGDEKGAVGVVESVAMGWARASLRLGGAETEIAGTENLPPAGQPVVYVCNHQSLFDIPLLLIAIGPTRFIAKQEVRRIPLVRGWAERWGCVFVNRTDARAAATAFREAAGLLREGHSLVVFAEGTRSHTDDLLPFKAGSFRIAQQAKVPVVPCCLQGTGAFYEQNGRMVDRRSVMRLRILPMIDTAGYTREDWKALPALCEERIAAAHAALRALPAGSPEA